jgi:heptose I phosphotransferase
MPADPAGAGLQPAGDGLMWLDGRFQARLQQAELSAFDAVIRGSGGRCLRVLKDRENWYFQPPAAAEAAPGLYLKKHRQRTWWTRLRAKLAAGVGPNAARTEARQTAALGALGIEVMPLVAYGERLRADGLLESFVVTEELAGYRELQDFLRRRFPPRSAAEPPRGELRRIVLAVAEIVRRLHEAGYNHRDLYCCHFLIREPAAGEFDIRLIDLQRVQRRRWFRRRWIIKDLAQLAYSAPRDRVGCQDQIALVRRYLGVRKLRPRDKRLLGAVLRKVRAMQRRLGESP